MKFIAPNRKQPTRNLDVFFNFILSFNSKPVRRSDTVSRIFAAYESYYFQTSAKSVLVPSYNLSHPPPFSRVRTLLPSTPSSA